MKDNMSPIEDGNFIDELKTIVNSARKYAYTAINFAQVRQNWLIGQRIVMQEQKGKARAEYGKQVINMASKALTSEFGKGFSPRSLWKFKQFYLMFNDLPILPTVSAESLGKKMPTMSAESFTQLMYPKTGNWVHIWLRKSSWEILELSFE